jgi:hypothetical protein
VHIPSAVKRTRRITVEIEQRSISISRTDSRHAAEQEIHTPAMPIACTVCGAAWVLVSPEADAIIDSEAQQILRVLMQRGLHTYFSAAGRVWVCSQSFQHLSEIA